MNSDPNVESEMVRRLAEHIVSLTRANVELSIACARATMDRNTERESGVSAASGQELSEALDVVRYCAEVLRCCTLGYVDAVAYNEVVSLGQRVGYSVVMACAAHAWGQRVGGSAFVVGPCLADVRKALGRAEDLLKRMDGRRQP
jgi:hypothetical protein